MTKANSYLHAVRQERALGIASLLVLSSFSLTVFILKFDVPAAIGIMLFVGVKLFLGWYNCASNLKRLCRCRPILSSNLQHARIERKVRELLAKVDLQKQPEIMVAPSKQPNIMVTGRGPDNALMVVTEEFLQLPLSDSELSAVLGHELAHLKSRDSAITALLTALGLATILFLVFSASGPFLGFLALIGASFLVKLNLLFISRKSELLADAYSAIYTKEPDALVSALKKLESWQEGGQQLKWWQSEHPPLAVRIGALEKVSATIANR